MTKHSRRDFIKRLGVFAGLSSAANIFSAMSFQNSEKNGAFEFLVVGDSLIWGQGLREEHKTYHLTKKWLEAEVFKNSRPVNMRVKAHSGARITLPEFEADELRKAAISDAEFFNPEINLLFPSIWKQLDVAQAEYENPQWVELILLSGGITNVGLSTILNPRKNNDELRRDIAKHCNEEMFKLLEHASVKFPNALIALLGYYPFLSKHTPSSRIFDNVLEVYDFPTFFQPFINNPLNRRLLKSYRNKMVERSLIWGEHSTLEFKKAVERVNAQAGGKRRVVFVEAPVGEENSIGAKNTLLYETGRNGKAQDALAGERKTACKETLGALMKSTDLEFNVRRCELATIGHPNVEGAKAYAEAIQKSLAPFLLNG